MNIFSFLCLIVIIICASALYCRMKPIDLQIGLVYLYVNEKSHQEQGPSSEYCK